MLTIVEKLRQQTTLLSAAQLAAILGIKASTIPAWKQRNRGPARIELGNTVRFDPAVVAAWLESQTVAPLTPAPVRQVLQQPTPLPTWLQATNRNKAQITGGFGQ